MSAGKRYKWQGSKVELIVGFGAESPAGTITGISQASPAVALTTTPPEEGQLVRISGVLGMTEVNGQTYIAYGVMPGVSFKLAGVDSTGYGAYTSGGSFDEGQFTQMCELTNYNRQSGTKAEMDATTICSTAKEFELDLPDFGTLALDFNYAPDVTVQAALEALNESSDIMGVRLTLPTTGGKRTFLGFLNQLSEQGGNGNFWKASATLRLTGAPVYVAAA